MEIDKLTLLDMGLVQHDHMWCIFVMFSFDLWFNFMCSI